MKNKKIKRELKNVLLNLLNYGIIGIIGTIVAMVSIKLGRMKLFWLSDGNFSIWNIWMMEYSLTICFLSMIGFYLLNFIYKRIKNELTQKIKGNPAGIQNPKGFCIGDEE
jgi:hypothetical protein